MLDSRTKTMSPIITVLPYCNTDHASATRLLQWIKTLDGSILEHPLLLAADDAVPLETKKAVQTIAKEVFYHVETILVKAPAPVNGNYHPPAAVMFERAMGHVASCYKWPWLWLEPDAVPLRSGWLDALSEGYEQHPKKFLGAFVRTTQEGVPPIHMPATMVYPNNCHHDLKQFCDGKKPFDMAFAEFVVPRGGETPLIWHRFGQVNDPPTFKEFKMPTDGPNVGTIDIIPKEAVLFHRCKDGSLIDLLRKQLEPPQQSTGILSGLMSKTVKPKSTVSTP